MPFYELISLPVDILVIVTSLLHLDDLVRWDSALCSKLWRISFLAVLSNMKEIFLSAPLQLIGTEVWFEWLMIRGVSLRTLATHTFSGRENNTFFAKNLSELNSLVLNCSTPREMQWLRGLLPHCENLLAMEIRGNEHINEHMELVSRFCPNLQSLCLLGDLEHQLYHNNSINEALGELLLTHPKLNQIIIINIYVDELILWKASASGKVIVYVRSLAHTSSEHIFEVALATRMHVPLSRSAHYFNCSLNECLRLLHNSLHDGEIVALTFCYAANIDMILRKFTSLTHLDLHDCSTLTEAQLIMILCAPYLQDLVLRTNKILKNVCFPAGTPANSSIRSLRFVRFESLQIEGIENILKHCVKLPSVVQSFSFRGISIYA